MDQQDRIDKKKREAKIQSCFSSETEVHIAKEPDELDLLIETFKLRSSDDENDVNSLFGKNKKMDCLIVMATFLVLLMFLKNLLIF